MITFVKENRGTLEMWLARLNSLMAKAQATRHLHKLPPHAGGKP